MADGKLNIKGTITIKTGKPKKKKRKPRKKKSDLVNTGGYTGTGKAETRQEFTPPYTAQALMTAMALRPPQVTYMEQPQQQPILGYNKFEDLPQLGYDVPVVTTRREFEQKAIPFLETSIQQGIKQKKDLLEANLRESERQLQDQTLAMRQELEQRQQFFENGLEQSRDYYESELARMEMSAQSQKKQMQLENIRDKAKFMTESVLDKAIFNIESQQQKKQLEQQIEQTKKEGRIAQIDIMSTAELRTYFRQKDPSFLLGNPNTAEMREEVKRREGLTAKRLTSKPSTQQDIESFFKPISQPKKIDPITKRLEIEKKAEQEYMQKFLEETTTKPSLSKPEKDEEIQQLLELYTQPEPKKYIDPRDERFSMYMEDIRIKPYIVDEKTGQIQQNPRYGLRNL